MSAMNVSFFLDGSPELIEGRNRKDLLKEYFFQEGLGGGLHNAWIQLLFLYSSFRQIQLISYKRYLECTLVQWTLSIYP